MVGSKPIFVSLIRNTVIELIPLKIYFLNAIGRQPTPNVICLVNRQLRKLDDSFPFYYYGDQFHHVTIFFLQMKKNPYWNWLIINYDCVNFNSFIFILIFGIHPDQ